MAEIASVPFRKRLYVWSVIFEPLSFFILFEESFSGISGNLSRILQGILVAVLMIRLLLLAASGSRLSVPVPSPWNPLYRYFWIYFALAIVAGLVGAFSGAYAVPGPYSPPVAPSSFAAFLSSPNVRPVFEYVVMLYYFGYFVVFSRLLLTSRADLRYAFSRFRFMFIASYVLGVIDAIGSSFGVYLIGRHIADWGRVRVDPGRFHGIAGEPRQAVAYLLLGLAVLHLQARFAGRRISRWWIVAILVAVPWTQSASGLIGIMLFVGLFALYAVWTISLRRLLQVAVVVTLSLVLVYFGAVSSKRIMDYAREGSTLWRTLESDEPLQDLMSKANPDIYPLYDLTRKIRSGDLLPVLIGSGFGSASAVTNRYYRAGMMSNPHSQLARSLYESGVIGTFFLIMMFAYPVKTATRHMPKRDQRTFMMLALLLVGAFLGYRTAVPFVYLGMFAAVAAVTAAPFRRAVRLRTSRDQMATTPSPGSFQPVPAPEHS